MARLPGEGNHLPDGQAELPGGQADLPGRQESLPGGGADMPGGDASFTARTENEAKPLYKKRLLRDVLESELHNYKVSMHFFLLRHAIYKFPFSGIFEACGHFFTFF